MVKCIKLPLRKIVLDNALFILYNFQVKAKEKERNMYKGYQEKCSNPWGVNEGYKHLQEKLEDLLPFEGR